MVFGGKFLPFVGETPPALLLLPSGLTRLGNSK
jgi:hypothetical protein